MYQKVNDEKTNPKSHGETILLKQKRGISLKILKSNVSIINQITYEFRWLRIWWSVSKLVLARPRVCFLKLRSFWVSNLEIRTNLVEIVADIVQNKLDPKTKLKLSMKVKLPREYIKLKVKLPREY